MSDDERRNVRKDVNFGGRLALKWGLIIAGVVAACGVAVWVFSVTTSDVKGQGDATKTKNSGTNRILSQKEFNDRYQDILATDKKIDPAKAALDADPKNGKLQTEYNGLVNYCFSAVGEYNSLARSYTAEQFRDADLPAKIDDTDPTTDCKETQK